MVALRRAVVAHRLLGLDPRRADRGVELQLRFAGGHLAALGPRRKHAPASAFLDVFGHVRSGAQRRALRAQRVAAGSITLPRTRLRARLPATGPGGRAGLVALPAGPGLIARLRTGLRPGLPGHLLHGLLQALRGRLRPFGALLLLLALSQLFLHLLHRVRHLLLFLLLGLRPLGRF